VKSVVVKALVGVAVLAALAFAATRFVRVGGDETKDDGETLRSLGYVGATPIRKEDVGKVGVVQFDRERASEGLNLMIPCGWGAKHRKLGLDPVREARLLDMDGEVLHTWSHDYPGHGTRGWANARIGPEGDLYVVHARTALLRLDWDSNLVWGRDEFFHHDLDFLPDGTVVGLIEGERVIEYKGSKIRILDNGFAFVTPEGKLKRVLWFYDLLKNKRWFSRRLDRAVDFVRSKNPDGHEDIDLPADTALGHSKRREGLDVFHANTVEVLDQAWPGHWNAGDIMTSFRFADVIAIFDADNGKVRWHWGPGVLDDQHDPTLLDDGHILVFDNGRHREHSRVLEIDPKTRKIVWKYGGPKDAPLFSDTRGLVQQLEGGTIFINESQRGRAVEIERSGDVVWEYFTPDVVKGHRISFRLHRLQGETLKLVEKQLEEG
jgi:hypothetical protein